MLRISLESNSQVFLLTWVLGVNLNSFAKGFSLDLVKMLQKKKKKKNVQKLKQLTLLQNSKITKVFLSVMFWWMKLILPL